jgi:hypothetical protein
VQQIRIARNWFGTDGSVMGHSVSKEPSRLSLWQRQRNSSL